MTDALSGAVRFSVAGQPSLDATLRQWTLLAHTTRGRLALVGLAALVVAGANSVVALIQSSISNRALVLSALTVAAMTAVWRAFRDRPRPTVRFVFDEASVHVAIGAEPLREIGWGSLARSVESTGVLALEFSAGSVFVSGLPRGIWLRREDLGVAQFDALRGLLERRNLLERVARDAPAASS